MQGIYKITNIQNNKVYIGQSINIDARWYHHIRNLIRGCHDNNHLQSAWKKYGKDSFEFSVLEECAEDILTEREQYWIDYYGGLDSSKTYNAKDASCVGRLSDESKQKISNTLKAGNYVPWNKGLTVETSEKVRQYCKKGKITFGGHHTEQTKQKISKIIQKYHDEGLYDYNSITQKRLKTIKEKGVVRKDKGTKKGKRPEYIGKSISEGKLKANQRKRKLGLPLKNQEKKLIPIKISICTVCGKEFTQRQCHYKKTCSKECRDIQISITHKERKEN